MVPGPGQRSVVGALGSNGAAAASKTWEKRVLQRVFWLENPHRALMPAGTLQAAAGRAVEAGEHSCHPAQAQEEAEPQPGHGW